MADHKLFNLLMAANASEEEIFELFEDLKFIYENPFDASVEKAVNERGCAYIEADSQKAN